MDGREKALMRASVSLQLLISTLKKHDLDAPMMWEDPRLTELFRQLCKSLEEAHASDEVTGATMFLNRLMLDGLLNKPGSVRGLLASLRGVDALLHEAGEKRHSRAV